MNPEMTYCKDSGRNHCVKYISWKGILAGALVAMGLTFLFNVLTMGIGLSLYTRDPQGAQVLAFSGFAWMLVGGYIIMFIGGWVAGRIVGWNHSYHSCNGMLHGFLAWTVFLILCICFVSHTTQPTAAVLLGNFTSLNVDTSQAPATSTVHKLGLSTLAAFFLMLMSALGGCIGGACGIKACKKCCDKTAAVS